MVSRGPRARAHVIYRRCRHGPECGRCYILDGHPARPRPEGQTVKPIITPDTFSGDTRATYGGRPRLPPPAARAGPCPAAALVSGLPARSRSGTGAPDPGGAMPLRPSWRRARTRARAAGMPPRPAARCATCRRMYRRAARPVRRGNGRALPRLARAAPPPGKMGAARPAGGSRAIRLCVRRRSRRRLDRP